MLDSFLLLREHPTFLYTATLILGLLIGSFLNVVIFRIPKMLEQDWKQQCSVILESSIEAQEQITLSKPSSSCPHCKHKN